MWLDHISNWNRERMQAWREIHLKYKTLEDFKENGKNDFEKFIKKREEPYTTINLKEVPKINKKTKKDKNIEVDATPNIKTSQLLDAYCLDRVWMPTINNKPGLSKEQSAEIMKKVEIYYNKPPLCILYGDDLLGTPMMVNANTNKLINKAISLRHSGFTLLFGVQAWKAGLPKTIRINAKVFALWQTADDDILKSFYQSTLSSVCSFKDFKLFFDNVIDGVKHHFLLIDRITLPIHIRLNWNIIGEAKAMIKQWLSFIKPLEKIEKKEEKKEERKNQHNFAQDRVNEIYHEHKRKRKYEEIPSIVTKYQNEERKKYKQIHDEFENKRKYSQIFDTNDY